jgi:hypothetical protein
MSMTCTSKSSLPSDLGTLVMTVLPAMSDRHAQMCCFVHSINLLANRIFPTSIDDAGCSTLLIG